MVSGFNHLSITDKQIVDVFEELGGARVTIITNIRTDLISLFNKNKKPLMVDVDTSAIGKHTLIFNLAEPFQDEEPIYVSYTSTTLAIMQIIITVKNNNVVFISSILTL